MERDTTEQPGFRKLAPENGGGKRGCIDRAAQTRPEMSHGTNVVFVGVRDEQCLERLTALNDEGRIRHQHVRPRLAGSGKGHTAIDHEPGPVVAVEVHVHADFAATTEREKVEIVWAWIHGSAA